MAKCHQDNNLQATLDVIMNLELYFAHNVNFLAEKKEKTFNFVDPSKCRHLTNAKKLHKLFYGHLLASLNERQLAM